MLIVYKKEISTTNSATYIGSFDYQIVSSCTPYESLFANIPLSRPFYILSSVLDADFYQA